ncbi:MAG: endolytic transglycosylase MltG [Gemmatimonadota bacterium]|nr:MAG: endolytic transglycosylase MltG [Gemmatimonadota bacterium]
MTMSAFASTLLVACGGPQGEPLTITVPRGATLQSVADTLAARGIIGSRRGFYYFARVRGEAREIRAGRYAFRASEGWRNILDDLTTGRVLTVPFTVPEGLRLPEIAERIANFTGEPVAEVLVRLDGDSTHLDWNVPGPGLEGYLFPDTYRFADGVGAEQVIAEMIERYHSAWTAERRARLEELGMTEVEAMTLASIVQAEARFVDEMPTISAVYHNRLEIRYPLQADPTVLYALGGRRDRLLFAAIDSVADHLYNTYTQPGLPPGPIGAPGDAALDAALNPADVEFLYFVARPDGTHIFTRSLQEHNAARVTARREWAQARRDSARRADSASAASGSES